MKDRCLRPKCKEYHWYGARGITICPRWIHSFEAFLSDMGPANGLTLDRIDPNGHYEPGNCRWVTQREQCNNKRNNVHVELDGQRLTIAEAARKYGVMEYTIRRRLKKGLTGHAALEPLPARTHCQKGHPWTPENILTRSNGGQLCRLCRRAIQRVHNARRYL